MKAIEKNLNALREKDPDLAVWLMEAKDDIPARLIRNSKGEYGVELQTPAGPVIVDGEPKARASAENLVRSHTFAPDKISLFVGMGLGFEVEHSLRAAPPGHQFAVLEPLLSLVRLALSRADFSQDIRSGRLVLFNGQPHQTEGAVKRIRLSGISGQDTLNLPHAAKLGIVYDEPFKTISGRLFQAGSQTKTQEQLGDQVAGNILSSLARLVLSPGVERLRNAWQGKPAILVNTGPSLGRNINHLARARGRALVISSGQALRPLLAYGVKPDLITFVDIHERNLDHFQGLFTLPGTPLVATPSTCSSLIQKWQGPLMVAATSGSGASPLTQALVREKGVVETSGISVAHFNLALAGLMGADPVILVGQDLAIDGSNTHFHQVDKRKRIQKDSQGHLVTELIDPSATRFGYKKDKGSANLVEGYRGGQVETTNELLTQKIELERMISTSGRRIVNSTEGGAKLAGTKQLSLAEALDRCPDLGPDSRFTFGAPPDPAELKRWVKGLGDYRARLVDLSRDISQALSLEKKAGQGGGVSSQAALQKKQRKQTAKMEKLLQVLTRSLNGDPLLNSLASAHRGPDGGIRPEPMAAAVKKTKKAIERAVDAANDFSRVLERLKENPQDEEAVTDLADLYGETGQIQAALECEWRLFNQFDQSGEQLLNIADLAMGSGRLDDAAKTVTLLSRMPGEEKEAARLEGQLETSLKELLAQAQSDLAQDFSARALVKVGQFLELRPEHRAAQDLRQKCLAKMDPPVPEQ